MHAKQQVYKKLILTTFCVLAVVSTWVSASEKRRCPCNNTPAWGASAIYRTADVIYNDASDVDKVSSFIPMLYYDGDYVFLDGLGGGVYLYNPLSIPWNVSLFTQIRFIDTPSTYQNQLGGAATDFGLRVKYAFLNSGFISAEALSDSDGRVHGTVNVEGKMKLSRFTLVPSVTLRHKSSEFNSHYYGLSDWDFLTRKDQQQTIGSGVDLKAGLDVSFRVAPNFYLHAGGAALLLDNDVTQLSHLNDDIQAEYYLGFGFLSDDDAPTNNTLSSSSFLRLSHGWGTPSNLGDIVHLDIQNDPYNSQLTTLFYGHPVSDSLFGLPISVYVSPGFGWHWQHQAQRSAQEYIVAIKAYYTFNWPSRWRVGIAEGLSYTSKVNYLESSDFESKGYDNPSQFLNYLDFSLDVNVGDLLNVNELRSFWLGYSIHHRSAIFEKSSQFGRMKGGSNYNMVTLTYDF